MGLSGTLIYNIDYSDPISEIQLIVEGTNGATSNKANPLEWCIQRIEVVDGSDVLYSMPGDVALAMWMHSHNKTPDAFRSEGISAVQRQTIPIAFGRHLYDPMYAFNPIAHRNPQLRITFDEAAITAAGATGYVTDSLQLSILCKLMEGGDAPRGFLMAKDVYDFTTAASGDERIDMPTDYPWRYLLVRAYEAGIAMTASVTNVELNCDGGRFVPFDEATRYSVAKMADVFAPIEIAQHVMLSDGVASESYVAAAKQGSVTTGIATYIVGASSFALSQYAGLVNLHEGTTTADIMCYCTTSGWAVHNTMIWPFGRQDVPEEWFDARLYNNVRLYLTQGNAGAEANVAVQQLRTY